MKNFIYFFVLALLFISCEKGELAIRDEAGLQLAQFLPADIEQVSLNQWKQGVAPNTTKDRKILVVEGEKDFTDIELLKQIAREMPVAYMGNAKEGNVSKFTGCSTEEEVLFIVSATPTTGFVTSMFPLDDSETDSEEKLPVETMSMEEFDKNVREPILQYARDELSLSDSDMDEVMIDLDSLAKRVQSLEQLEASDEGHGHYHDGHYHEHDREHDHEHDHEQAEEPYNDVVKEGVNEIFSNFFLNQSDEAELKSTSGNLSDYAYRKYEYNKYRTRYNYKFVWEAAKGRENNISSNTEKYWLHCYHDEAGGFHGMNPHLHNQYRILSSTVLNCIDAQYVDMLLHNVFFESYVDKRFEYEWSKPDAISDATGAAGSAQTTTVGISPSSAGSVSGTWSYAMGQTWSYSLPDVRIFNAPRFNNASHERWNWSNRPNNTSHKSRVEYDLISGPDGYFYNYAEGIDRTGQSSTLYHPTSNWPLWINPSQAPKPQATTLWSVPVSTLEGTNYSKKEWTYMTLDYRYYNRLRTEGYKFVCAAGANNVWGAYKDARVSRTYTGININYSSL